MTWPTPIIADDACPPDKMFMMPPDVTEGLQFMKAAAVMRRHGVISQVTYDGLCKEITDHAVQAAREGRIGVITNIGEPK